jgi:LPXTG-motif cell wall-anchored protein
MKKKTVSFAVIVFLCIITFSTFISVNPVNATDDSPFAGGSGTREDPYQIKTIEQLDEVRRYRDDHFILTQNIDASQTRDWNDGAGFEPVASVHRYFTGSFDGQGFVIRNLYINRPDDKRNPSGLFGRTDGSTIKNVGLVNVNIKGRTAVGALVAKNNGNITNCFVTGSVSGRDYVGGLAGTNRGNITNCYSTAIASASWGPLGGLVGFNAGTITKCYTSGNVDGRYTYEVGGLVGQNTVVGIITKSYSTSTVAGYKYSGGLVGLNRGIISNCYTTGRVTGTYDVGGLAGNNSIGNISYSYSTASVSGYKVGGLVAYTHLKSDEISFWNLETSNQTISADGIGKTTAEMKIQSTFTDAGWDFTDVWDITSSINNGYPHLRENIPTKAESPYILEDKNTGDSASTPGFQFIIALISLGLLVFLKKKRIKNS